MRILPSLLNQTFAAMTRVFDEAIAVHIAEVVDPVKRKIDMGPQAPREVEVSGVVVIGAGQ